MTSGIKLNDEINSIVTLATGHTLLSHRLFSNRMGVKTSQIDAGVPEHWNKEYFTGNLNSSLIAHLKDLYRCHVESVSDKIVFNGKVRRDLREIGQKLKLDLEIRKQRLTELLKRDNDMYSEEIKKLEPTEESKRAEMIDALCDIKTKKEIKRQEVVKEKRELQLKINAVEVRDKASDLFQEDIINKNNSQIITKGIDMAKQCQESMEYGRLLMKHVKVGLDWEAEESKKKKKREVECLDYVIKQIEEKELLKKESTKEKKEEAELRDEQLWLYQLEEAWEKQQKKKKQQKRKDDLDKGIKNKLKAKCQEVQQNLMLEQYFLKRIIDVEGKIRNEAAAAEEKQVRYDLQQKHIAYLEQRRKEEELFEKTINSLYLKEARAMLEKKDIEWEKDRKEREKMNKEHFRDLHEIVERKLQLSQQNEQHKKNYDKCISEQVSKDNRKLLERAMTRKEKNIEHQKFLLKQIKEKEEQAMMRKDLALKEDAKLKKEREELQNRLDEALTRVKVDDIHPYQNRCFDYTKGILF